MGTKGRKANQKGEANNYAKLTAEQVLEIRRLYKLDGYTQSELGRRYGIGQQHVSKIVRRQTWDHI